MRFDLDFTPGHGRGEHPAVTLSFLYRAFYRVL